MRLPGLNSVSRLILVLTVLGYGFVLSANAQEKREPAGGQLPPYARAIRLQDDREPAARLPAVDNDLPNIMLTGYWPPTNEMLRQFSPNPEQNPEGWVGEDWEGRGYNIYAFFPEFPYGLGKGEGDFEVDYQDTSNDWWPLVDELKPITVISFGRAGDDYDWELEGGNRMYELNSWASDYLYPYKPTPDLPIADETPGTERWSSLPMQAIVDAVAASGANVYPYYTTIDNSNFLCNFMGYHANWYHDEHADPDDPARNVAAGFIHLGSLIDLPDAILATEVTVRTVIDYVNTQVVMPGDLNCDGEVDFGDINPFVLALTDPAGYAAVYPNCNILNGDINEDDEVDFGDINPFVALLTGS